jgi:hypothetical protein
MVELKVGWTVQLTVSKKVALMVFLMAEASV